MNEEKDIWPFETGILDLPADWEALRVEELASVRDAWQVERERLQSAQQLENFTKQLNREWAIETGIIENLYEIERGVTQTLIEQGFQAALLERGTTNKPREWVIKLLKDQQDALEGLFQFIKEERPLSTSYIKQLHSVMLRNQTDNPSFIIGDWKKWPNHPERDGIVFQYAPPEQVASEMDRLIAMHIEHLSKGVPPEIEAAWLHHRFSQIHPFQDGNGRVARTLASLVFIQKGLFPLVVTRDDKVEYLDALEAADAGSLRGLITQFAKLQRFRYLKAASTSETMRVTGVSQALQGLRNSISKKVAEEKAQQSNVISFARILEDRIFQRLSEIAPEIREALRQLKPDSFAQADRSTPETSHFFRGQIIEIARDHLNYYANPRPYQNWVRLKMIWTRRANLVFTFHAIGYEFSGVLVCSPFLEFRDDEDDNETQTTLVPIATEPFDFYYNESEPNLRKRFEEWSDAVLIVALAEIQKSW